MQQVVVIHGGTTFPSREAYLSYLQGKKLELADLSRRNWKSSLSDALGSGFAVYTPRMPNGQDARYMEWKVWFEKILNLLEDDVILVGHSLGGIFLLKYLAENEPLRTVRGTYCIAPPYFEVGGTAYEGEEYIGDFALPNNLSSVAERAGRLTFYFSSDDFIVPISHADRYAVKLPAAAMCRFEDRGHFLQEEFHELVEDIQTLVD